jgi:glutamate-1-semialdehyde 2,1-aminomutase
MSEVNASKSSALFDRAQSSLPGGVSRNTLLHGDHPLYVSHSAGARVVDVDGVERIDFANNMASLIHGHAFDPIVDAVSEQLRRGTAFTMATEAEIRMAESLRGRASSFEKIRFINSGTEAVMTGIKAARAFTGRHRVAKIEGCYHGAYDYAEMSQAPAPANWGDEDRPNTVPLAQGTPPSVVEETIILPFNDPEKAIAILNENADQIACVLMDPIPHRVGMLAASPESVQALRTWTIENGALLMFDEVISFRNEFGGMQARFDFDPDITSLGKIIGGGFPIGALAGRSDVMDVFVKGDHGMRLPHSGTFSGNPISITAGLIALEHFDKDAVEKLNALGDYARAQVATAIHNADVPACVTGSGSLLRVHLKPEPPRNYRESYLSAPESAALNSLIEALYDNGIMMIHTCTAALSTAMTPIEIDRLADAMEQSLIAVREQLLSCA